MKTTQSLFISDPEASALSSYLRLTLNNDFSGRAAVPHCMPLWEQHPGIAITIVFMNVLEKWQVANDSLHMVV
jgi:hypothetical protein